DRILVVSDGSGSGSDAFPITITDKIPDAQKRAIPLKRYIKRKEYITYGVYAKYRRKLKGL
ncbi:MAG: hydroxymethylglutaryl-CoA synthase, partial [candidate division WOR-3 bacterium]